MAAMLQFLLKLQPLFGLAQGCLNPCAIERYESCGYADNFQLLEIL
jgi:hypothetical protein